MEEVTIIFVMWATTDHIEFILIIVAKILEVIHYKDYTATTFTVSAFITCIYDTAHDAFRNK
jgi:hypothetical protein